MAHKLSFACAEMILRYHLLPQQILFTHNWDLSRHCCVVVCFCVCVLCGLLLFVCVFGLFLLLVLVVGVFCFPLERDRLIGLCGGLSLGMWLGGFKLCVQAHFSLLTQL